MMSSYVQGVWEAVENVADMKQQVHINFYHVAI